MDERVRHEVACRVHVEGAVKAVSKEPSCASDGRGWCSAQ